MRYVFAGLMVFMCVLSFFTGYSWYRYSRVIETYETSKTSLPEDVKEDPKFSKLDDSITVNYLNPENIATLQKFLSDMKQESPLMSFKLEKGPVKYYSPNQLNAIRKVK